VTLPRPNPDWRSAYADAPIYFGTSERYDHSPGFSDAVVVMFSTFHLACLYHYVNAGTWDLPAGGEPPLRVSQNMLVHYGSNLSSSNSVYGYGVYDMASGGPALGGITGATTAASGKTIPIGVSGTATNSGEVYFSGYGANNAWVDSDGNIYVRAYKNPLDNKVWIYRFGPDLTFAERVSIDLPAVTTGYGYLSTDGQLPPCLDAEGYLLIPYPGTNGLAEKNGLAKVNPVTGAVAASIDLSSALGGTPSMDDRLRVVCLSGGSYAVQRIGDEDAGIVKVTNNLSSASNVGLFSRTTPKLLPNLGGTDDTVWLMDGNQLYKITTFSGTGAISAVGSYSLSGLNHNSRDHFRVNSKMACFTLKMLRLDNGELYGSCALEDYYNLHDIDGDVPGGATGPATPLIAADPLMYLKTHSGSLV
jgi:hypothetical protein